MITVNPLRHKDVDAPMRHWWLGDFDEFGEDSSNPETEIAGLRAPAAAVAAVVARRAPCPMWLIRRQSTS